MNNYDVEALGGIENRFATLYPKAISAEAHKMRENKAKRVRERAKLMSSKIINGSRTAACNGRVVHIILLSIRR